MVSLLPHMVEMDQETWLRYGWEKGWCSPPVCYTHDGIPMSTDEDDDWINGEDVCLHIFRVYEDQEHRLAVEYNHSPSTWRASNRGWERGDS